MRNTIYEKGDALTSYPGMFREVLEYDAHGNVTSIACCGSISSSSYGVMDNLTAAAIRASATKYRWRDTSARHE